MLKTLVSMTFSILNFEEPNFEFPLVSLVPIEGLTFTHIILYNLESLRSQRF